MSNVPIYRWSGEYFGFISNSNFFNSKSVYLGWVDDDGSVWDKHGVYLGELVDKNYILINTSRVKPVNRVPKVQPISPVSPVPTVGRVGRVPRIGYQDVLDKYK